METLRMTLLHTSGLAFAFMLSAGVAAAQCQPCEETMDTGSNQWLHRFNPMGPPDDLYDDDHVDWRIGTCSGWHNECGLPEWESVDFFAPQTWPEALRDALDENPAVVLNRERRAIQALNCKGTVIAHIPLASSQLSSLRVGKGASQSPNR